LITAFFQIFQLSSGTIRAGVKMALSSESWQSYILSFVKPSKAEKADAYALGGAKPYERSNAWVERCKILVKNFDRTLKSSNIKLKLCLIRLMFKRLATASKDLKWVL
jgi:hypothetical protein